MTKPFRPLQASSRARTARPAEDVRGADPPSDLDASGTQPDSESPPSTPRWVKSLGIIAIVLLLVFAGLHLTGNAPTHMPSGTGPEHGMQAP
ncbi:MAG: hypothetical protein M3069_30385 [Chloroflexota bacterium]|nr:hypothetical protein [Chloroflexota bacterium]